MIWFLWVLSVLVCMCTRSLSSCSSQVNHIKQHVCIWWAGWLPGSPDAVWPGVRLQRLQPFLALVLNAPLWSSLHQLFIKPLFHFHYFPYVSLDLIEGTSNPIRVLLCLLRLTLFTNTISIMFFTDLFPFKVVFLLFFLYKAFFGITWSLESVL